MIDSLWRQPGSKARGDDQPPPDILVEERERRSSRFWLLWPGRWFTGGFGVAVLVVFVVGGMGWVGYQGLGKSLIHGSRAAFVVEAHPESGRVLTVSEYAVAEQFGLPVALGDGGLPLIRVYATGEVRELTPVEAEFDSVRPIVEAGYRRVVWTPGPRGWGMWWKDNSEELSLRTQVVFPRHRWRERQEDELELGARVVTNGLREVSEMDVTLWKPGMGPALLDLVQRFKARYPPVEYGEWGSVPGMWGCDPGIEVALTQGVTQGCPSLEYMGSLSSTWYELGLVVDRLEKIGRLGSQMDRLEAEELYQSQYRMGQTYFVLDLLREGDGLAGALKRLFYVSLNEDLVIDVKLFRESG